MRIGVIGVGKLGSLHLRIYGEIPGIRQIYLVDTNPGQLSFHPDFTSFSDYHNLLGKVDLVSIATPTSTHFEIARFFLKNKVPVLVEKPLASNYSQAKRLISLSRQYQTLLFVGHVERYNNAYRAVKKLVKNPVFIECHRLSPYPHRSLDISVVLDLMIHDLDLVLDLVKDGVRKIEAKAVKVLSKNEDIANARLTFKRGCVANITSSRISSKKERKIRIFMRNCYISLDFAEQKAQVYQKRKNKIIARSLVINRAEPLKEEITEFVALARRKRFTINYAASAKDALALALRIQRILKR